MVYFNDKKITSVYYKDTEIKRIYYKDTLVYDKEQSGGGGGGNTAPYKIAEITIWNGTPYTSATSNQVTARNLSFGLKNGNVRVIPNFNTIDMQQLENSPNSILKFKMPGYENEDYFTLTFNDTSYTDVTIGKITKLTNYTLMAIFQQPTTSYYWCPKNSNFTTNPKYITIDGPSDIITSIGFFPNYRSGYPTYFVPKFQMQVADRISDVVEIPDGNDKTTYYEFGINNTSIQKTTF